MIFGEGGSAAPVGGKQERNRDRADWTDLQGYFAKLLRQGISTNIGTYVGSSQIWTYVRGEKAGPPTADELKQMQAQVDLAMRQGALGVASSLSGPPGSWIDTDTLVAMCEVASRYGGIYSTHMRTEGRGVFESVAEAIEIGRRAQVPGGHHSPQDRRASDVGPDAGAGGVHRQRARQRAGGGGQCLPLSRRAEQPVEHHSAVGPRGRLAGDDRAAQGPVSAARVWRVKSNNGIPGSNWYNHYTATGGWDGMLLVSFSNPKYKQFEGKRMNEVIQAIGKPGIDVLFELLEENRGSVPTVYFHHSEEDMKYALRQPFASIGSDGTAVTETGPLAAGNPHPRYYGTFPRVLGKYVREEKVISIEEAIRKMTSANTAKIRVFDRGLLRPGQWADVTVFDAGKIIDHATYEKPHQYATGVEYLLVNGKVVLEHGQHTGARPGAILYGQGKK